MIGIDIINRYCICSVINKTTFNFFSDNMFNNGNNDKKQPGRKPSSKDQKQDQKQKQGQR